jgi:hypothetical protein
MASKYNKNTHNGRWTLSLKEAIGAPYYRTLELFIRSR